MFPQEIAEFRVSEKERNGAEEAFQACEGSFRSVVDSLLDAMVIIDPNGAILFLNSAAAKLMGLESPEAGIGLKVMDFIHQDFEDSLSNDLAMAQRGNDRSIAGYRLRTKKGAEAWGEGLITQITFRGSPAVLLSLADITKRKRAEQALRESQEKYRLFLEKASEAILIAQDGMMRFVNRRATEITGYSEEELTSRPFVEFVHPEDRDRVMGYHLKRLKGEEVPEVYAFRIIDKNGNIKWLEINGALFTWEGRLATLNFVRDIMVRRQTEKALRESEARWHFALEGSGDAVWDWNVETNEFFFSKRWAEMLGYAEHEINKGFDEWDRRIHPEDREKAHREVQRYFRGETPQYVSEHRVLCKDNTYKWVLDRGKIITWTEDGRPLRVVGTHTDITKHKLAEEELKKAYEELKGAQEKLIQSEKLAALGRFSAGIAHEIKNPLGIILGGVDFIRKKMMDSDENIRIALEKVKEATLRADKILTELLQFSRPSKLIAEKINAEHLIADTLSLLRYRASLRGIKIAIQSAEELYVRVDKDQLQQVLFNLLLNSVEAITNEGEITIKIFREQKSQHLGGKSSCTIQIIDTGEGIAKGNLSRVFEPFYSTKLDKKGTGLGLAIAKMIVDRHGGNLVINSEEGKGTNAKLILPLYEGGEHE